ncbi:UPF0149 family protein [Thiolapillus brandeum]|uniref:YecA family protein n=1 Tax=Thiolapillus brandeum TaxID=1076588 RepID=A0A7U6JGS1_9GAMM|nr:UPF0149 family protein [Thiolapillus brandeum]BAO43088.1 conserved hypothetical protein [Thiolapillus brandeum]
MNAYNPDYQTLWDRLGAAGLAYSPAETHGILTGMLCTRNRNWRQVLCDPMDEESPEVHACLEELENLWIHTATELRDGQMPLTLMLPGEDAPINERALALRDWAQGFLYGFGLGGEQQQDLLNSDAGEALRDFSEIARMDVEEFGDHDEAEEALMQLEEYLWVATSLIWHEAGQDDKD